MTEREKIIKVIDEWASKAVTANKFDGASVYNPHNAAELADALIAAGLVADVQSLADGNCVLYVKGKGFMRLYNEQDINEMIHRAEVAERALLRARKVNTIFAEPSMPNILAESALYEAYIRQAEKELAEENSAKN